MKAFESARLQIPSSHAITASHHRRATIKLGGLVMHAVIVLLVIGISQGYVASRFAWADPESVQSWPKDTSIYFRAALIQDDFYPDPGWTVVPPEDGIVESVILVDPVISNIDSDLTNTDLFNDGETSIAINPENPNEIVMTAFSGFWGFLGGTAAPLWRSTDGGATWSKSFSVPQPPGVPSALGCPCDQTVDYGRAGQLSGAFLSFAPTDIYSGTTTNPDTPDAWSWLPVNAVTQRTNTNVSSSFGDADQPWLLVNRDPIISSQDNVYVAYDDFGNGDRVDGPDMRVAVSFGANPPDFHLDAQTGNSLGVVNPGHRLAVDPRTGFVYSLFQRNIRPGAGGSKNIDYMLNRSTDGGMSWALNGSAFGIVVANADSTQPTPKFGTVNALLGGVIHAAVDPNTGAIYYVYGSRDTETDNNRLAVRRITSGTGPADLVVGPESFVTGQVQAALPSVAVRADGRVGVFYYTFDGFSDDGLPIFTAHLGISTDEGANFSDTELLTFLSVAADNGNPRQRVLGDYMQMKAVGNCFIGSFTANGVPFGRPFANHDPIFFKVCGEAVSLLPDLTETAISDPPATVRAGSRFQVTDTVRNDGPGTAAISTTRFFLSVDTLKNHGDRRLRGRRIVPELLSGGESTGTTAVRVPLTTAPGTYFLLACADNKKSVAEVDDKNNCIASTTPVTVEP